MLKAGDNFVCTCCEGSFSEIELRKDVQWGPVCMECKRDLTAAEKELSKAGIDRPMVNNDINDQNKRRFKK